MSTPIIHRDIEQRTPEWYALKAGKLSASTAADLMSKTRAGKPGAARQNLIASLAVERLTGEFAASFVNDAMRRGIELEPEAREAYIFETGNPVEEVALVEHGSRSDCVCSPDGLVFEDGMVEIKCPASMHKHLANLQDGAHAREYKWQAQFQLFVTGRQWVDMASYDPRFPPGLQLAVARVQRDAKAIDDLEAAADLATAEIESILLDLRKRSGAA